MAWLDLGFLHGGFREIVDREALRDCPHTAYNQQKEYNESWITLLAEVSRNERS